MSERQEKITYYFKRKNGSKSEALLIRRVTFGKNLVSYQSVGEFTAQQRDILTRYRKWYRNGRFVDKMFDFIPPKVNRFTLMESIGLCLLKEYHQELKLEDGDSLRMWREDMAQLRQAYADQLDN